LLCATDAAGGFTGAILLTDNRARPQHFAFVQPIKPTIMQRILYGTTLEEHIKIDVITQKLWDGLPSPPDVVFVEAHDMIQARRVTHIPTALIAKLPDTEPRTSSFSLLRYDTGINKIDDFQVGQVLVALENSCNLLEPFNRIRGALKEALKSGT
jgi:hypothetical protein